MVRITFVYPDFENLGVEYLMGACLQAGHEVELVFYLTGGTFLDLKKQSVSFGDIAKRVAATKPHLVAFSSVTDNYRMQLNCAQEIKKILPDVTTIFGGVHPTLVPELVLKEKSIDAIAIGEAEISFLAFLDECRVSGGRLIFPKFPVNGIIFKREGDIIGDAREGELADIDTLAFVYKKKFYQSFRSFSYAYTTITSRGCPYICSYCFHSHLYSLRGKTAFRQRKVGNIISEILQAKRDYAPRYIWFADDSFTTNEPWLMEFCQSYKNQVNIPFGCVAIPEYLNKGKIEALGSSGCYHVQMGVQSLNEEICSQVLKRGLDRAKISEAIYLLRNAGIVVQVDHMLGIPGDTIGLEEESVLFYNKFRPHVIGTYWLAYYPKTKITETARLKGLVSEQDIVEMNEGRGRFTIKNPSHNSADSKRYGPYYGILVLLQYLPLLPRWLVRFIVKRKLYQVFALKNYFIAALIPSLFLAFSHPKNFIYRKHFNWFINRLFYKAKLA